MRSKAATQSHVIALFVIPRRNVRGAERGAAMIIMDDELDDKTLPCVKCDCNIHLDYTFETTRRAIPRW